MKNIINIEALKFVCLLCTVSCITPPAQKQDVGSEQSRGTSSVFPRGISLEKYAEIKTDLHTRMNRVLANLDLDVEKEAIPSMQRQFIETEIQSKKTKIVQLKGVLEEDSKKLNQIKSDASGDYYSKTVLGKFKRACIISIFIAVFIWGAIYFLAAAISIEAFAVVSLATGSIYLITFLLYQGIFSKSAKINLEKERVEKELGLAQKEVTILEDEIKVYEHILTELNEQKG